MCDTDDLHTRASHDAAKRDIRRWAEILFGHGAVAEIRVLGVPRRFGKPHSASGWFDRDRINAFAAAVQAQDERDPVGVYATINPVKPALLARAACRVKDFQEPATGDRDIERRRLLFIDIDPERPTGICSTPEEKVLAEGVADEIELLLRARGWPEALRIDSGNGAYLLYAIDEPTEDGGLIAGVLKALADRFSNRSVKVDGTAANPARIARVPGTWNRKGDSTKDRAHRLARIVRDPGELVVVEHDLLVALTEEVREESAPASGAVRGTAGAQRIFDVPAFLAQHGIEVLREASCDSAGFEGGRKWLLHCCPFDPSHTDKSAVVMQAPDGKLGFRCQHNSCTGRKWRDFRAKVDSGYADREGQPRLADPAGVDRLVKGVASLPKPAIARPVVVRLADVLPAEITYLWSPRIPRGALTMLDADPGTGKSTLARVLAAKVSCGGEWPDGGRAEVGNVLFVGDEDSLEAVVRPHLGRLDADLDRILQVRGIMTLGPDGKELVVALGLDNVALIDRIMKEHRPSLVVVDPVQAHLGAEVDINRANEVRPVLAGLARLGERHDAAIVLVRHLAKGSTGANSIYRGLGSIDFVAAARSALVLRRHPDTDRPDDRVLSHVKSNASRQAPPLEFRIQEGGRIEWLGQSDLTEDDLRAAELPQSGKARGRGRPRAARDSAAEWLREALAGGPVATQRLLAQAEDAGHSESTLRKAAAEIGVVKRRTRPGKAGAPDVPGTWVLPAAEAALPDSDTEGGRPLARAREGSIFETPERETASEASLSPAFQYSAPPRAREQIEEVEL